MGKISFAALFAFILFIVPSGTGFAEGVYKWVDEKGTVHFSDNPGSTIFEKGEKKPLDKNAVEIAGRLAIGNRQLTKAEKEAYYRGSGIRLPFTTGQSSGSSSSGSGTRSPSVRRA